MKIVKKAKKTKAELEADKLLREEEEKKGKAAEDKRLADLQEKARVREIQLQTERNQFRETELERLCVEYNAMTLDIAYREKERMAEELLEVDNMYVRNSCTNT